MLPGTHLLLYSALGICLGHCWRYWSGWTVVLTRYRHTYFCVTKSQISLLLLWTLLLWKQTTAIYCPHLKNTLVLMHLHQTSYKSTKTFCTFLHFCAMIQQWGAVRLDQWLALMQKHFTSSILMKLWYLHSAFRANNLVFIARDTRGEDSRAVQPRACFLSSGAARKRQTMSSPEEALVTTPAAISQLTLWFCAGNATAWKKFPSNDINCLYKSLVPLFLMGFWQA